jgi:hypothetical protein
MSNWSTATTLERLLTIIGDGGTGDGPHPHDLLDNPELIDQPFPKASDLIVFLKDQVIREAFSGRTPKRPVKKAAPKKATASVTE